MTNVCTSPKRERHRIISGNTLGDAEQLHVPFVALTTHLQWNRSIVTACVGEVLRRHASIEFVYKVSSSKSPINGYFVELVNAQEGTSRVR